jgi:uroporphyrinogen decarboxylase
MHDISSVPSPALSRHRVRKALDGREPDRVPFCNLYASEDVPVAAGAAPQAAPESDFLLFSADLTPRYPVRILQRDGDAELRTTPYGGVCRVSLSGSAPSEVLDYPVKSRADWELVSRRLAAEPDRIDWAALEPAAQRPGAEGLCVALAAPAGLRALSAYTGGSLALDLMGGDPGFVRDIADAHAALLTGMAELILARGHVLDAVLLADDPADRKGLRFPPARYRPSLAPSTRRLIDFFHGCDIKVLCYAGGDLRLLVPELLDTGLDCLGPLEVAAGMDLPFLKINYGANLAFLGGIDRRALHDPDPAVLEREIATKVRAGMVNGRYIAGFDGPLPAGLPPEQHARAVALLSQYGKY